MLRFPSALSEVGKNRFVLRGMSHLSGRSSPVPFWKRVLVREWSSSVHFQKMEEWILQVLQNPLWLWLWKAWPVTIRFSERNMQNISENWFIQMFQEFWIFWWIIYLLFLVFFLSFLIKNYSKNYLIYWGFLWISWILIAWIFLHSFEDIWVSLLLFLILWIWVKNISQN